MHPRGLTRCLRCQRRLPPSGECPAHGKATVIADAYEEPTTRIVAPRGWTLGPALASGATAVVHQVHRTGTDHALMKLGRRTEPELRVRFALEAEVLRSVGPPTTPALFEHGTVDEVPYLIMEYLSGETLARWMSRTGERGGVGEIVAILIRLAAALEPLHAAGYVHRDLKPENIMIGGKGVRLLDFGLVKPIRARPAHVTQDGVVVGTPHYLAPEQIKPVGTADHRIDLYSFGVIAFEMLTGQPPFVGERRALEYHHVATRPPLVSELRGMPPAIDEIVAACLAKSPDARPPSAEALRKALSAAFTEIGTLRGVMGGPEPGRDSRPLGANTVVALAWIEHADPVAVTRAVSEARGIVVRHRGAGVLAAFPAQEAESPLPTALDACRALVGERRRCVIHLATALLRRSAHGKPALYGTDLENFDRWSPAVPYTGMLLTTSAARALGDATPVPEVPGFFREGRRDRTDATDARVDPPLVGRESLIRSLTGALGSAAPVLIGISGIAGAGKTRLLRAIAERLHATGLEVIQIAGTGRFLGDRPDDERLTAALGGGETLEVALAHLGSRGAVLIVDDLPLFSPRASRAVLQARSLRRIVASEVALFEVHPGAADQIQVELPPLSYADAGVLLRSMLQPARLIPDVLVERLAIRGTGNPGLLIALARDIKRRGAIRRPLGGEEWYVAVDELDTLIAPPGPAWLASRLLEDLPVEVAPIARMSAGLGARFLAEEVTAVTTIADAASRLPLLVHERVLGERNGWYSFEDLTLQQAIYDHLLDERALVHRRALEFWLGRTDRNLAGRLARVAFHAAGAGDSVTAVACWTALARTKLLEGDAAEVQELLARCAASYAGALSPAVLAAIASLTPAS